MLIQYHSQTTGVFIVLGETQTFWTVATVPVMLACCRASHNKSSKGKKSSKARNTKSKSRKKSSKGKKCSKARMGKKLTREELISMALNANISLDTKSRKKIELAVYRAFKGRHRSSSETLKPVNARSSTTNSIYRLSTMTENKCGDQNANGRLKQLITQLALLLVHSDSHVPPHQDAPDELDDLPTATNDNLDIPPPPYDGSNFKDGAVFVDTSALTLGHSVPSAPSPICLARSTPFAPHSDHVVDMK